MTYLYRTVLAGYVACAVLEITSFIGCVPKDPTAPVTWGGAWWVITMLFGGLFLAFLAGIEHEEQQS